MIEIDDDDIAVYKQCYEAEPGRRSIAVDVSDLMALAVGDYILMFAGMEAAIDWAIQTLLHTDDLNLGAIVTAQASFAAKLELLGSLHKYRCSTKSERDAVDDLIKGCREVGEMRNRLVHSPWIQLHRDQQPFLRVTRAKARDGLRVELVDLKPQKLLEAVMAAQGLTDRAYEIFGSPFDRS